jgi:hypothetical protein
MILLLFAFGALSLRGLLPLNEITELSYPLSHKSICLTARLVRLVVGTSTATWSSVPSTVATLDHKV